MEPSKKQSYILPDKERPPLIKLGNIKSDTLKQYIEKPTNDKYWCKKIEIKISNSLLKVISQMIVNSYGLKKITY